MGVLNQSIERLEKFKLINPNIEMLELGCQNIYCNNGFRDGIKYGMIAREFFKSKGMEHVSVDINGEQGSIKLDLRESFDVGWFDVITDYGTTEHIEGTQKKDFYMAFKNIFKHCKVGGYIIHEVPKKGHWGNHGKRWYDEQFFKDFANMSNIQLCESGEFPAMENSKSGMLIYAVLKKVKHSTFPTIGDFMKLKLYDK